MLEHLGDPAIFPLVEGGLGLLQHLGFAPHELYVFGAYHFRRQVVQIGRIARIPAHVTLIDGAAVVAQGAVVATVRPEVFELRRQLDLFGDLLARVAHVHQAYRLVMDVLVEIALLLEVIDDVGVIPARPVVALELDLDLVAPGLDGFIQIGRPLQRIPYLGTAQGQDVVHGVGGVLRHPQRLVLREPGVHLGGCFGARGHLEDHLDAVDVELFTRLGDQLGGQNQRGLTGGGGHAQTAVDATLGIAGQQGAIHVDGAAPHGIACDHIFGDGMFGEAFRGDDLCLLTFLRRAEQPGGATIMVNVAVAVDHGQHRALALFLVDEGQGCLGGVWRNEGVEDDPALVALDEGDVGEIETTDLIDAVGDLVQAVLHGKLGVAPQTGVDGIGGCLVQAYVGLVLLQIPDNVALVILDGQGVRFGDEAPLGIGEVLLVVERQAGLDGLVGPDGALGGRFGIDQGEGCAGGKTQGRNHQDQQAFGRGFGGCHRSHSLNGTTQEL
ncbi:hypothetical protein D3C73_814620 [compost metagenome]